MIARNNRRSITLKVSDWTDPGTASAWYTNSRGRYSMPAIQAITLTTCSDFTIPYQSISAPVVSLASGAHPLHQCRHMLRRRLRQHPVPPVEHERAAGTRLQDPVATRRPGRPEERREGKERV